MGGFVSVPHLLHIQEVTGRKREMASKAISTYFTVAPHIKAMPTSVGQADVVC